MRKSTKRNSSRRFEALEARQMMAGDVTVAVVNGNLQIYGDDVANQIAITSGEVLGTYFIRGLEGTTVRLANAPAETVAPPDGVRVTGVRNNVAIRMGGGDDVVRIDNATFRGAVGIGTGEGADRVVVGSAAVIEAPSAEVLPETSANAPGVRIGRELRIESGAGNDNVRLDNTSVRGVVAIFTDGGNDEVVFGHRPPTTDPPALTETDSSTAPPPFVRVGGGVKLELGEGNDAMLMHRVKAGRGMALDLGAGSDLANLAGVGAGNVLSILGGRGDGSDRVTLTSVRAERANINTGAGNDSVRVIDSAFALIEIALGEGDDELSLGGVKARLLAADGGPGADTLTRLSENMITTRRIRNFETQPEEPAPPTTSAV